MGQDMGNEYTTTLSRRGFVSAVGAVSILPWVTPAGAKQVYKETHQLKPGEYTWHPERSPHGAVAAVVSIPEQLVHVYRNGIRIGVSTCSTGKKGHATPTGVFTVLQKDKHHRSSTYNNAPMPNMNRLTWSGIALHAGKLPGYPASHGCVRLPFKFSQKLFGVTHVGTPVIISGSHSDPWELIHPGLVLGDYAEHEFEAAVGHLKGKKHPSDWTQSERYPVTSLIASSADRSLLLFENGNEIARSKLTIKGPAQLGEHVFVLQGSHNGRKGMHWRGISHHVDPSFRHKREEALVNRLGGEPQFIQKLRPKMHPGMVMVVTDLPTHPSRRSGSDFVIMTVGS